MSRSPTLTSPLTSGFALQNARLVVISGKNQGSVLALKQELVTVGTLDTCDLVLDDSFISQKHFQIARDGNFHRLKDLQSKNGTQVNGLKVTEITLVPGAVIRVGESEIFYHATNDFNDISLPERHSFGRLLGKSMAMRQLYALLEKISPSDITVLIEGESGTGKELAAQSIHTQSRRAKGPFVVVDCGAISQSLIEGELFGFEKGAFTGADRTHVGAFERANKGTVFLDELGELKLDLQPKLLRVLEQREVQRLGATAPVKIDVRVIAATNRSLEAEVDAKRFREDLFYRLSVMKITMPSLRDRKEDIPLLVDYMVREQNASERVSKEALGLLCHFNWPGNIRQLRNVIQRASVMAEGREILAEDLHFNQAIPKSGDAADSSGNRSAGKSPKSIEDAERHLIIDTLKFCKGNKTATADTLGIAPSTLYAKIKKYKITEDK